MSKQRAQKRLETKSRKFEGIITPKRELPGSGYAKKETSENQITFPKNQITFIPDVYTWDDSVTFTSNQTWQTTQVAYYCVSWDTFQKAFQELWSEFSDMGIPISVEDAMRLTEKMICAQISQEPPLRVNNREIMSYLKWMEKEYGEEA